MEGISLIIYVNSRQKKRMLGYLNCLGIEPGIQQGFFDISTFKFRKGRGSDSKLETLPIEPEKFELVYKNLPERIGCFVEAG